MRSQLELSRKIFLVVLIFCGSIRIGEIQTWAQATQPPITEETDINLGTGIDENARGDGSALIPNPGREFDWTTVFLTLNPMLIPLILCSIVTMGYTIERMFALRRSRVIPSEFVSRFVDRLAAGKLDRERAQELCRAHESSAARIFAFAIRYWGQPAPLIRQAVDADSATEISEMKRNIRILSGTTTLAPLLGLLGTVIGLIQAFGALAQNASVGTSQGQELSEGISLALVATAFGLIIAVVSVVSYFYLMNKVDRLVRTLDEHVMQVIQLIAGDLWSQPPLDYRSTPASYEPRSVGHSNA